MLNDCWNNIVEIVPFWFTISLSPMPHISLSIHPLPASNISRPNVPITIPFFPLPLHAFFLTSSIISRLWILIAWIVPSDHGPRTIFPTAIKGQCRTLLRRILARCCVEFKRSSAVRACCYGASTVLVSFIDYLAHFDIGLKTVELVILVSAAICQN
jgi:hypothetical protein